MSVKWLEKRRDMIKCKTEALSPGEKCDVLTDYERAGGNKTQHAFQVKRKICLKTFLSLCGLLPGYDNLARQLDR